MDLPPSSGIIFIVIIKYFILISLIMPPPKKILVVGAGPSGLVAVKEMLAAGHDVMSIEAAPDIGGVFRVAKDWSYKELYLTISNLYMAFSDFPPLEKDLRYSTKEDYFRYLKAYTDHFGLMPYIVLNTRVKKAKLSKIDGPWYVEAENCLTGKTSLYEPDVLIVATGSNHVPNHMDTTGFSGNVLHSSEYRGPEPFKGQRVLVVGMGESGSDVTNQLYNVGASEVTVWTRRFPVLAPRFMTVAFDEKVPYDEYSLLKEQGKVPSAPGKKVSDFLEMYTTGRWVGVLPPSFYVWLRHHFLWSVPDKYEGPDKVVPRYRHLSRWCQLASKHDWLKGDQTSAATKNCFISVLASYNRVNTVIAPKAIFDGSSVHFSNVEWYGSDHLEPPQNKSIQVDTIITCTGYRTTLDWIELPDGIKLEPNPRTWYKHCFPPLVGDKLMFLGWTRPHQGGIPACSELLSRYIALLLEEKGHSLPDNYGELAVMEGSLETKYYDSVPQYKTLMDYPAFTDSVAGLIGCRPKVPPIWHFERFLQYWIYPTWPCWFRKNGPGANPKVVDEILDSLPLDSSLTPDPLLVLSIPVAISTGILKNLLASLPLAGSYFRLPGQTFAWRWIKPRVNILSGNEVSYPSIPFQAAVWTTVGFMMYRIAINLV